jgi:hypothetical protein
MHKMLEWVGYLSGVLLVFNGGRFMLGGLVLAVFPITEESRRADEALAQQVRRESIERGDEPWMAEYHYADTCDLSEQAGVTGIFAALFGALQLCPGCAITVGWVMLLSYMI